MATFSVRFLGCKVSYADAQAVRERLLGDGHAEVAGAGEVAIVNTCCVTNEAVSKSRQAVSRAARTHRRVYVTGCAANLTAAFAALRETEAASRHLHVPMQSGDDRVLREMGRRYSAAQYVAKLEPLDDFNLTADVIVGFPGVDALRVHAFPYSPRPGTVTASADTVAVAVKRERSARLRALSDELSRRRWASRVGSTDRVLVDRPGRGYGDDYTPWLVDGKVGQLVRARAVGVSEEGIVAVAA